ncbi:MAG TPA: peptidyl-prolyl cis-trans isomerase [Candidatus Cloacimonadota bacterium]|nr:peptidyl-prolyl cis-trans isomerase [Candidatus Cloacimonadota bacterium]
MSNIKLILLTISLILISSVLLFAAESEPTPVKNDNKLEDRDVLAEFQGGQVLRKDLQNKISKLPPNMQGRFQTIDGQLQVLDIITTEEVFYRKAIDLGIDKSPDVRDKILQVQKRYYLQEYYKRNVSDLVTLTEEDMQSFYQDNLNLFYLNPNITIHYIQTASEADAQAAIAELNAGASFAEVSDKYNQNTYAKGLKGVIKNIRLNGNIPGLGNDPVLEARIGETTADPVAVIGPVQTDSGWHIFRTVDIVAGRQKEFLEVKPEIEQRMRPAKERDILDALKKDLIAKYQVQIDTVMAARIDLQQKQNNIPIENEVLISGSDPELNYTVTDLLNTFTKVSPQEQIYYIKGGGAALLMDQELIQKLIYVEARNQQYERYFDDNEEYVQMKRNVLLRRAFEYLVLEKVEISDSEVAARYEQDIESYVNPAKRTIQVLFFENEKTANKAWKKFAKAHKKDKEKDINKIISKYSTRPQKSIFENQYDNGIVTGVAQDAEFSKRIWANPVGYLSPVFTANNGDIVFFRTLSEDGKSYKPLTEVEPRVHGMIKQEKEKAMQDKVIEELNVEYDMKKYPERIQLNLSADELFTHADNAARSRNYKDAIIFYDQIIKNYTNGVDDYKASFMKAFLVAEEMQDKDLALQLFRSFLTKYPEGDLHESARFMIDSLEGNIENFEDFE